MSRVHIQTESKQDYVTPMSLINSIEDRFGLSFVLDLAASVENARCPVFFTKEQDSLAQNWTTALKQASGAKQTNRTAAAWLNPEFKKAGPFMQKCSSNIIPLVALTLTSQCTDWYLNHVQGRALVLQLVNRVKFEGQEDPYPKELQLVLWNMGMIGNGWLDI